MDVLKEACILSCEEWLSSIENIDEEHVFSKKFEKEMNKLCDKMRGDKYHRFTRKATRFLIVAAVIFSMTITAFAVPASREYIIKKFLTHSVYSITDVDNINNIETLNIGYVPTGYIKGSEYTSEIITQITYTNSETDRWFTVSKYRNDSEIMFDTEEYEKDEIEIDGIKYITFKSSDSANGVIWNNDKYIYKISGSVDNNELIHIAKSVN